MWERVDADHADEAHVTAAAFLHYYLTSRGVAQADLSVNPVVIAAFQRAMFRTLAERTGAKPAAHWVEPRRFPLAHGVAGGRPVSVVLLPVGAPWAVMLCEELIAIGARTIIAAGAAGSLQSGAPVGALVVPTGALREEGTSYHYAPPEQEAAPAPALADALAQACRARGVTPQRGLGWTTDAPFREMRGKVERLSARGVLVVDMEASAMFVLGQVRRVEVASLFIVSDELFHPWRPAFFDEAYAARVAVAAEAVVEVAGQWAGRHPLGAATGVASQPDGPRRAR